MGNQFSSKFPNVELANFYCLNDNNERRASHETTLRFVNSYAARYTLMQYFEPREFAQAQILSRHFYEILIGTVQTRLSMQQRTLIQQLFFTCRGSDNSFYVYER